MPRIWPQARPTSCSGVRSTSRSQPGGVAAGGQEAARPASARCRSGAGRSRRAGQPGRVGGQDQVGRSRCRLGEAAPDRPPAAQGVGRRHLLLDDGGQQRLGHRPGAAEAQVTGGGGAARGRAGARGRTRRCRSSNPRRSGTLAEHPIGARPPGPGDDGVGRPVPGLDLQRGRPVDRPGGLPDAVAGERGTVRRRGAAADRRPARRPAPAGTSTSRGARRQPVGERRRHRPTLWHATAAPAQPARELRCGRCPPSCSRPSAPASPCSP